jgi:hypothetical protein
MAAYDPFVLIGMIVDALDYAEAANDPAGIQKARSLLNTEMPEAIKEYARDAALNVPYPWRVKETV